ncbi:HEAT repeat domain-containing protein [Plectonema cf. radiosum LEGE 06105]|uniref:HEAT repeat domain-containing protein n=1 Tax=Plectonema cf. radiosum LEGE 06105 TaxID=945769 RepID=A0A8J7F900_9CYAN|nr:HEAT repeat domain-containing protein [Plectonema radiosum]MBE9213784.1 HEAT repeat domain-containing protein [Plectonema cf. radiosum LEGE 06105]
MSQLTQALERILEIRKKIYPSVTANLNPGLTINEIEKITKDWQIPLPTEIYELYQWRNGFADGHCSIYEFASLFDIWGFEPLQNLSIEKQPSPYEYELDTPFYALNILPCYEYDSGGYIVFDEKGETKWVEMVSFVDGFSVRIDEYYYTYYYTNLTNMVLTIANSYEKAYYQDNRDDWKVNEETRKNIWYQYNSSKLSESTLNKIIQITNFNFINQLFTNNINFIDPTTQEPLIQILQQIKLNTEDKNIKEKITRILGEGVKKIPKEFSYSNLLKEYWKIKEPLISSSQRFHLSIEEEVYNGQSIKQIDQKRREQSIKIATIFILFMLKSVNTLTQALSYDDAFIRSEAAWALGEIKALGAAEPLIEALQDENKEVRQATREALLKIILKFPEVENLIPF